jgi:hypothetical protein
MKIAVFGASGMVGSRVAAEAVGRGHEVTGVTRSGGELPAGVRAVQGSANDVATVKKLDADVLVAAIGPSRTGGDHQEYLDAVDNLIAAVRGTATRLFVVGGAGSLVVNGNRVVDDPNFPAEYKTESLTVSQALENLRATGDDVNWTMLSPALVIAPGERTGTFRLGSDEPVGDHISAEDYAIALIDEAETPAHNRARFTLGY